MERRSRRTEGGFTLIETLVALGLLAAVCAGVAQLFAVALDAGRSAEDTTLMSALAVQRLEELRALEWSLEVVPGLPPVAHTDLTTDLSVEPGGPGGPGLAESPGNTLDEDTAHYVDYLDVHGRWVSATAGGAGQAVFVRRWAVHRLPADPERTLAVQVLVSTKRRERMRRLGVPRAWTGQDVLLESMRTRTVR